MFLKPFRVKTSTTVKSSERKKWKCRFEQVFHMTPEDLDGLIPNKSEITIAKLETFSGEIVNVYCAQKNPYFFEIDGELFPTVYTLWKHPELLKTFTTWPQVFPNLSRGADLMLPGVVLPPAVAADLNPRSYGNFERGTPCAVNLTDNKAPVGVGRTAHSSMDMYMAARRGKAVIILHFYTDQLWEFGDKTITPALGSPFSLVEGGEQLNEDIEALSLSEGTSEMVEMVETDEISVEPASAEEKFSKMDDVFVYTFLKTLKLIGKQTVCPVLTSTFYKTMMIPNCPSGFQLDVKKTEFKKLSKFLSMMQEDGFIQVKELTKGVESITAINFTHDVLKAFVIEEDSTTQRVEPSNKNDVCSPPTLEEIFFVTADVLPLFTLFNYQKGSFLSAPEVRDIFRQYVATKNLKNAQDKSMITLDDVLQRILKKNNSVPYTMVWDQAVQICLNKMTSGTRATFPGQEPRIIREKLKPIEITVARRAANKTVTLVTNLELFGIDPHELAHTIQVRVATSTSVNPTPNKKEGNQVLIQGNQVHHLSKLLLDEFKIPKRYVKGLELAKKNPK